MMRRRVAACAVLCGALVFFMPLVLLRGSKRGGGSSHDALQQHHQQQQSPQQHVGEAPDHSQHRRLQQNDFSSSTIPPEFTQLDRAAETQRIYRSVAAERCAGCCWSRGPGA
jgi:transcription initiation factor TFIID subunit TAF12